MLETVVDELSYVILTGYSGDLEDYSRYAEKIIFDIDEHLGLMKCFRLDEENKGFSGYDVVYSFGNWKCLIAYNSNQPKMGIYIKFTGVGLKKFLKYKQIETEDEYEVYNLTQEIYIRCILNDRLAKLRLSKIDFAIDYINEGKSVTDIYERLDKSIIRNDKGRKNQSRIRTVVENGIVQTIYIGNHRKKGGSKVYARIYDKKIEQIETKGIYYDKAIESQDWVRFEVSFSKDLAHTICDDLMNTFNKEDLTGMIFRRISDKYRFYDVETEEVWPETEEMLKNADRKLNLMGNTDIQKTDLLSTYQYLVGNSGLYSFMYKIKQLYGVEEVDEFLNDLKRGFDKYRPTKEVLAFINEKKADVDLEMLPWKK